MAPSASRRFRQTMSEHELQPFALVTSGVDLPAAPRIWGTGGWQHTSRREALDWLTLSALLGWQNTVIRVDDGNPPPQGAHTIRWLVVGCDPAALSGRIVDWIARQAMNQPLLVVTRAGSPGSPVAAFTGAALDPAVITGQALVWSGPGSERRWSARRLCQSHRLLATSDSETWTTLDGTPCVLARRVGPSLAVTLGFHPSDIRDRDPVGSALIKTLLVFGAPSPVAWLDLQDALVLRMDDAGGAQNVHSRSWQYAKLQAKDWCEVAGDLKRLDGRVSVGYSAGWVDDGDASRGRLTVAGQDVPREPGRVHPSSLVVYEDRAGHSPGCLSDYRSEFRGIQALRQTGRGDVEVHGFTHMHPDGKAWACAADRFENIAWFREFGEKAQGAIALRSAAQHPLVEALGSLRDQFGVIPTTLICPGDQWTDETLECALDLNLQLVSSYYLAIRRDSRFCWCQHVCAPYLDTPDCEWFAAELPVVGYFHDRDLAVEGIAWMRRCLERWKAAGARRLIDFRELAGALSRTVLMEETDSGSMISVSEGGATPLVRALPILFTCDHRCPQQITVETGAGRRSYSVEEVADGIGRVSLAVPLTHA